MAGSTWWAKGSVITPEPGGQRKDRQLGATGPVGFTKGLVIEKGHQLPTAMRSPGLKRSPASARAISVTIARWPLAIVSLTQLR